MVKMLNTDFIKKMAVLIVFLVQVLMLRMFAMQDGNVSSFEK